MQMNQQSGVGSPMDLIPRGFLCWAMLSMRGMKTSTGTGSRYADLELTIAEQQPFARKKIFTRVADPDYSDNSDGYRQMGMTALTRMVEAAGIVNPEDASSYEKLNGKNIEQVLSMLDGKYVAIKVKIEPGKDGYEDKNDVGDFLTPNTQSQSNKHFMKLSNGDHGITVNPAAKTGSSFGSVGGTSASVPQAARPASSFGQPQQQIPAQQQVSAPAPQENRGFNPNKAPSFLSNAQR